MELKTYSHAARVKELTDQLAESEAIRAKQADLLEDARALFLLEWSESTDNWLAALAKFKES